MRNPDINRIKKAIQHVEAAKTVLSSIKWDNTSMMEDHFIHSAKDYLQSARCSLEDVITINKAEEL